MSGGWFVDSLAVCLAIVIFAGALEKLRLLAARTAAWNPLFVTSPRLRRYATPLVATALLADSAVLVGLFFVPQAAALGAVAAFTAYTALALNSPSIRGGGSCGCAGWLLEVKGRRALVIRNALLIAAALILLTARVRSLSDLAPASYLVAASLLTALSYLLYLANNRRKWSRAEI